MHNIISQNQMAEWNHIDIRYNDTDDAISEYFDCIIECADDQPTCKRICNDILR